MTYPDDFDYDEYERREIREARRDRIWGAILGAAITCALIYFVFGGGA